MEWFLISIDWIETMKKKAFSQVELVGVSWFTARHKENIWLFENQDLENKDCPTPEGGLEGGLFLHKYISKVHVEIFLNENYHFFSKIFNSYHYTLPSESIDKFTTEAQSATARVVCLTATICYVYFQDFKYNKHEFKSSLHVSDNNLKMCFSPEVMTEQS